MLVWWCIARCMRLYIKYITTLFNTNTCNQVKLFINNNNKLSSIIWENSRIGLKWCDRFCDSYVIKVPTKMMLLWQSWWWWEAWLFCFLDVCYVYCNHDVYVLDIFIFKALLRGERQVRKSRDKCQAKRMTYIKLI